MEFTTAMDKSLINKEVTLTTKGLVYSRAQILRTTTSDLSFMYNGKTTRVSKRDIINVQPYIDTLRKAGLVK